MKALVGHGVFSWDAAERRSNRYGSIHLDDVPYNGVKVCSSYLRVLLLPVGKRVRITAKVVEARDSGHIGDLFLKISPSRPEVGEEVDLGVGVLETAKGYDGTLSLVLQPNDGRKELWIDPRKLYRLHDQTVDLYVEETSDPFSEAPVISCDEPDGAICTGIGDNSLQMKRVPEDRLTEGQLKVCPEFKRLGDGLFSLDFSHQKGKRFGVC